MVATLHAPREAHNQQCNPQGEDAVSPPLYDAPAVPHAPPRPQTVPILAPVQLEQVELRGGRTRADCEDPDRATPRTRTQAHDHRTCREGEDTTPATCRDGPGSFFQLWHNRARGSTTTRTKTPTCHGPARGMRAPRSRMRGSGPKSTPGRCLRPMAGTNSPSNNQALPSCRRPYDVIGDYGAESTPMPLGCSYPCRATCLMSADNKAGPKPQSKGISAQRRSNHARQLLPCGRGQSQQLRRPSRCPHCIR
jgi:hypothetical protein